MASSSPSPPGQAASTALDPDGLTFLPSTQPEVVRAFEKDTYYAAHYVRALRDALRTLFGPQVLAVPGRAESIAAIGTCAYLLLSTASADLSTVPVRSTQRSPTSQSSALPAVPSVGEEYVGALAVDRAHVLPVSRRRRALWTAVQSLLPFLALRTYSALTRHMDLVVTRRSQALVRARARWVARLPMPQRMQAFALTSQSSPLASNQGAPAASATNGASEGRGGDPFVSAVTPILDSLPASAAPVPPIPQDRLLRILLRLRAILPDGSTLQSLGTQLGALHLALFYLNGKYYTWGQRLLGVRYLASWSMGRARENGSGPQAPSYALLGVLLLIQLAVKLLRVIPLTRMVKTLLAYALRPIVQHPDGQSDSKASQVHEAEDEQQVVQVEAEKYTLQHGTASRVGPSYAGTETLLMALETRGNSDSQDVGEDVNQAKPEVVVPLSYPDPEGSLWPGSEHPSHPTKRLSPQGAARGTMDNEYEFDFVSGDEDNLSDSAGLVAARDRARDLIHIAEQTLRCTLCMDRRAPQVGTSAVLECGHVFDWECILDWAREKAECPLCRQDIAPQRIWPIYNL